MSGSHEHNIPRGFRIRALLGFRYWSLAIGLALDGGYWMIGLCAESAAMAQDLFEGVAMSATHTGLSQIRRMHACGRRVRLLPTARDLDTIEDLKAVAALGGGGTLAVVAAEVLATVG